MSPSKKIVHAFLYVPDKCPVFVFEDEAEASKFHDLVKGAEFHTSKTHVFLPTPHGLELVRGGKEDATAFGTSSLWVLHVACLLLTLQ
jgi:hypothetical protein